MIISRRKFILSSAILALATPAHGAKDTRESEWSVGVIPDTPFNIDIVNIRKIPPAFRRQDVRFEGPESPGTLVVDAANRFLYYVTGPRRAIRFGIAVGREGAAWKGQAVIGRKAKWPTWTPTANMRRRNPKLPVQVKGGPENPLGCPRALSLPGRPRHTLPHPRHQRAMVDRQGSIVGLHPDAERGCLRALWQRAGRSARRRQVRDFDAFACPRHGLGCSP